MQCFNVLTIYIKTPGFKVSLWQEQNGFVGLSLLSSGQLYINPVLRRIPGISFVGQDRRWKSYSLNNIIQNKNKPYSSIFCVILKHFKMRCFHQHLLHNEFGVLVIRIWKDTATEGETAQWKAAKAIRHFHVRREWRLNDILPLKTYIIYVTR